MKSPFHIFLSFFLYIRKITWNKYVVNLNEHLIESHCHCITISWLVHKQKQKQQAAAGNKYLLCIIIVLLQNNMEKKELTTDFQKNLTQCFFSTFFLCRGKQADINCLINIYGTTNIFAACLFAILLYRGLGLVTCKHMYSKFSIWFNKKHWNWIVPKHLLCCWRR